MAWYIILGLVIGFGLYLLYSNKGKSVNMPSASGSNVHDHSKHNDSGHHHKKGHGCC